MWNKQAFDVIAYWNKVFLERVNNELKQQKTLKKNTNTKTTAPYLYIYLACWFDTNKVKYFK